ncbi:glycosyltransferase family 2 protein [Phaeobacter sp. QD34_3]|uniref:glycosyltransferase family 2 protein n=1 Tax=unclassified Phaeobacter TaxID=2621772 RepID=UPI00237EEC23|nr:MULTISPECIES: glycosyltransferase family 2 protein [unclassified Phaeobacter]MDE4131508.1 glycosyltransferase family 2 protein [Phaeobacter sp. QD34_3]MDE4135403.1 glycosyltransferase family 2 protein [Phaeobacter sp. QD34_24]
MKDITSETSFARRLHKRVRQVFTHLRFRASLRHLHGPRSTFANPDEVTLIALVRDGSYYLEAFFDHYRSLGIRHFVFFDNGSEDDTIERIRQQPGTAIVQSKLPWGQFENMFRSFAAGRYARDRWCLIVDMDEIFDFEGRQEIGLAGLIRYLQRQGHTAMMAQMLEMFPQRSLSEVAQMPYGEVLHSFDCYDLSVVSSFDYHAPATGLSYFLNQNRPNAADGSAPPRVRFGGIRAKVFGENCCLSKHPLVFVGTGVTAGVHPHAATGVDVAPMTALLKHYKFANDPLARDRQSVKTAAIEHGEDQLRLSVLSKTPDLSLWSETARQGPTIEALQDLGFLSRSDTYSSYLRAEGTQAPS